MSYCYYENEKVRDTTRFHPVFGTSEITLHSRFFSNQCNWMSKEVDIVKGFSMVDIIILVIYCSSILVFLTNHFNLLFILTVCIQIHVFVVLLTLASLLFSVIFLSSVTVIYPVKPVDKDHLWIKTACI